MPWHAHAHRARINFVIVPHRPPHSEKFRFVVQRKFRRGKVGNDFLQLSSPIDCGWVRGQQASGLSPALLLFRLKPLEEFHRGLWVVTGSNQVLSRKAIGPLLLVAAEAGARQRSRPATPC